MNVEENNTAADDSESAPAPMTTEAVLVTPPPELSAASEPLSQPEPQPDPEQVQADPAQALSAAVDEAGPGAIESSEASAEAAPAPAAESEPAAAAVSFEGMEARIRRHHVAPAMIALDRIDEDPMFQIREEGDITALATDIARLGQLFPVDIRLKPPDRFQIISGFRRVAALRFLHRDRVLARLHTDLGDEDALLMALVSAIHALPVEAEALEKVKARLEGEGRLTPAIRSMLEKALAPEDDLAPETVDGEQEIEAEELANDVTLRLGEINQDLSLLADVFDSLDAQRQEELLTQLRYSSELVAYLEGKR